MISLPSITLICLTNKDLQGHLKALKYSCAKIDFGDIKMIYDEKCNSIDKWNYKIIYELPKYITTDFCMLIHADGFIANPDLWKDEWLNYDYIGAPWPLPNDAHSYRDEEGEIQRIGNSVSLRSKKLMDLVATRPKEYFWSFKEKYGNTNEDGFICCHNRKWLESQDCKFAPIEVAKYFSKEYDIPENRDIRTFAFHSL